MLTKNLVRFSIRKGKVYPRFIDPNKDEFLEAAESMTSIFEESRGLVRDELLERTGRVVDTTPKIGIVVRGFEKLLLDRTEFETPEDDERPNFRASVFAETSRAFADESFASIADYDAWVLKKFGKNTEDIAAHLFSDLPGQQPILDFKPIQPEVLIHRYNCALIQWLLLHSAGIEATLAVSGPETPRKIFKHLRFHRLLAEIDNPSSGVYQLKIDGPLNLFFQTKKYGMNLARFFPALLHLPQWRMTARIDLKNRKGLLELDQTVDIEPDRELFTAFVPKEIKLFQESFSAKDTDWQIEPAPRFVNLPGDVACFPDFTLVHESGVLVSIELFHRWHATQLEVRLQQLAEAENAPLILGVDHALARKTDIAEKLAASSYFAAHGFKFRDIPTINTVLPVLERFLVKT